MSITPSTPTPSPIPTSTATTTDATLTVNPALSIAPTTLADATAGTATNQTITVSDGTTPYTTFDCHGLHRRRHRADGGEPHDRCDGGNRGALRHADGGGDGDLHGQRHRHAPGGTLTQTYTLTVNPALSIAPATLLDATAGTATNQIITVSGGTTPYTTFDVSRTSTPAAPG